jgi:hypothetical protein
VTEAARWQIFANVAMFLAGASCAVLAMVWVHPTTVLRVVGALLAGLYVFALSLIVRSHRVRRGLSD